MNVGLRRVYLLLKGADLTDSGTSVTSEAEIYTSLGIGTSTCDTRSTPMLEQGLERVTHLS